MDQTTILSKMTPEQRLMQAIKLSDSVRELSLKGIQDRKKCSRKQAIQQYKRMVFGIAYKETP